MAALANRMLSAAGLDASQAIMHGERALGSVAADRVEPLLQRLASLADSAEHKIDVYERQTDRCKGVTERLFALSRAALKQGSPAATENDILSTWTDYYVRALHAMDDIEVGGSSAETRAAIDAAVSRVSAAGAERLRSLRP